VGTPSAYSTSSMIAIGAASLWRGGILMTRV